MSPVFKKLGLKDRKQILVVISPASFEGELAALEGVEIFRDPKQAKEFDLALAFVTTYAEVDRVARQLPRSLRTAPSCGLATQRQAQSATSPRSDAARVGRRLGKRVLSLSQWSRLMRIGPPCGFAESSSSSK
jgi:hypothetical protein